MCILFSPFFLIYLRMYIYAYLNSKHNLELDNLKLLIENIYIITEIAFKIAPCFFFVLSFSNSQIRLFKL